MQPLLFILCGPVGSGKTTYLLKLVNKLQQAGIRTDGFVSERSERQDSFYDYSIRDLQSGRSVPLSSRSEVKGWIQIRHFYFNPEAITMGKEILASVQDSDTELVAIDEVGPFELDGKIWSDFLQQLLSQPGPAMIWVARTGILDAINEKWKLTDPVIINIGDLSIPEALKKILSKLHPTDRSTEN